MVQANILLGATALLSSVTLAHPVLNGSGDMTLKARDDKLLADSNVSDVSAISSGESEKITAGQDDAASTFDHDHKHYDLDDIIIQAIKDHIKAHHDAQQAQQAQQAQKNHVKARGETAVTESLQINAAEIDAIEIEQAIAAVSSTYDMASTFDHDHKHYDLDDMIIQAIKDHIKAHHDAHQAQQAQKTQQAQQAQQAQKNQLTARDTTSAEVSPDAVDAAPADMASTFDHDHKHYDLDDMIIQAIKDHIKAHHDAHQAQQAQQAQKNHVKARGESSVVDSVQIDAAEIEQAIAAVSSTYDMASTFDHDHKHYDLDDMIIQAIKDHIKAHHDAHQAQQAQKAQQAQQAPQAQKNQLTARDTTSAEISPDAADMTPADVASTFDHDHKHYDLDDMIIQAIKDHIKAHHDAHQAQQAQQAQKNHVKARGETAVTESLQINAAEIDAIEIEQAIAAVSSTYDMASTFDHDHKHYDLDDMIIQAIKDHIKAHHDAHQAQQAQQSQKNHMLFL